MSSPPPQSMNSIASLFFPWGFRHTQTSTYLSPLFCFEEVLMPLLTGPSQLLSGSSQGHPPGPYKCEQKALLEGQQHWCLSGFSHGYGNCLCRSRRTGAISKKSDLWVLLWSLESDQIFSDPTEICRQDVWRPRACPHDMSVCSTPMAMSYACWQSVLWNIQKSKCYLILTVNRLALSSFISQVYRVPNKSSCYWHVAMCYNSKFLPETAFKRK